MEENIIENSVDQQLSVPAETSPVLGRGSAASRLLST